MFWTQLGFSQELLERKPIYSAIPFPGLHTSDSAWLLLEVISFKALKKPKWGRYNSIKMCHTGISQMPKARTAGPCVCSNSRDPSDMHCGGYTVWSPLGHDSALLELTIYLGMQLEDRTLLDQQGE